MPNIIPSFDLTVRQYLSGMQHCLQNCRICPRWDNGCEFLTVLHELRDAARICSMAESFFAADTATQRPK